MQNRDSSIIKHLTIIGLLGSTFIPRFRIGIDLYIVTIIPFVLMVVLFGSKTAKLNINKYLGIYSILLLSMLISIFHSYIFLNVPPIYRDFMEWLKYLQFLPYFLAISYLNYDSFTVTLEKYILAISVYVIIVSILEYTDVLNLGQWIGAIYTPVDGTHFPLMFSAQNRLVGTGADPNIGAMILSFLFLNNLRIYIRNRKGLTLVISIILILCVLLTQSRTVLIGLIISGFIALFTLSRFNILYKLLIILGLFFIVYTILYSFNFEYITIGIETALEGKNQSVNLRIENYLVAFERFDESPFLGIGPAKAITSSVIDSEYALIIQRYGLMGSIVFVILFLMLFKDLLKLSKINREMIYNFVFILLCAIFMFTNNVLAGYQLGGLFVLIILLIVLYKNKIYFKDHFYLND